MINTLIKSTLRWKIFSTNAFSVTRIVILMTLIAKENASDQKKLAKNVSLAHEIIWNLIIWFWIIRSQLLSCMVSNKLLCVIFRVSMWWTVPSRMSLWDSNESLRPRPRRKRSFKMLQSGCKQLKDWTIKFFLKSFTYHFFIKRDL